MAEYYRATIQAFVIAHCIYNILHAIVFPVERIHIPLDWIIVTAIHCVNQFIVVRAVWRSEYLHILSGQLLDLFVHIHYLCLHLACRDCCHIIVVLTVISGLMPFFNQRLYTFRVITHKTSCHKKCSLYVVLVKCLHHTVKILCSPGTVK